MDSQGKEVIQVLMEEDFGHGELEDQDRSSTPGEVNDSSESGEEGNVAGQKRTDEEDQEESGDECRQLEGKTKDDDDCYELRNGKVIKNSTV